jgi:hypothetical protein
MAEAEALALGALPVLPWCSEAKEAAMPERALRRLHRCATQSPRFPLVASTLLVMAAFGLGWFICSIWTREIFVGIGPANTTFRRIAMEAAATMSNTLGGVRVIYCDTKGTAETLEKLEQGRIPLLGRFFNRDCGHLDLAIITDGTRHVTDITGSKAQVLAPVYPSYLQVYTRDDIYRQQATPDLAGLLNMAQRVRLGVATKDQAAYDRACTLFGTLKGNRSVDCAAGGFDVLGFSAEVNRARPRELVELLLSRKVDAIVLGGPPCPEGTQLLGASAERKGIRALGVPKTDGFTTKPIAYPCLGGQTAETPVTWTYLAARDDVPLSFNEIHATLKWFGERLPRYFPDLEFATFTQPTAWTPDIRATGLGLDWLDGYLGWLKGSSVQWSVLLDYTAKLIALFSAIIGLIVGVRNVAAAMRAKPA